MPSLIVSWPAMAPGSEAESRAFAFSQILTGTAGTRMWGCVRVCVRARVCAAGRWGRWGQAPKELVVVEGGPISQIYFLTRGTVGVYHNDKYGLPELKSAQRAISTFGEHGLESKEPSALQTLVTFSFCEFFALGYEHVIDVSRHHGALRKHLKELSRRSRESSARVHLGRIGGVKVKTIMLAKLEAARARIAARDGDSSVGGSSRSSRGAWGFRKGSSSIAPTVEGGAADGEHSRGRRAMNFRG